MPLAAFATLRDSVLDLRAAWGDADGLLPVVQTHASATVTDLDQASALGEQVASALRAAVQAGGGQAPERSDPASHA
jgi:hydroxymethylbilane synthase